MKESAHQLIQKKLKETGLRERWTARDNFIFIDNFCHSEGSYEPIAKCNSNIIALHIACAHNAILESAP